jgi:hypothetical protein
MIHARHTPRDMMTGRTMINSIVVPVAARIARLVGKAEFTVREWCRLGRVNAEKRASGRGKFCAWVISHTELLRYRRQGLLQNQPNVPTFVER